MNLRSLSCLTLLALVAGCTKTATVIVPRYDILVAGDGSGNYSSIQQAVNAAGSGEVIYVKSGVYSETVEINGADGIQLVGAGPNQTVIDAGREYAALTISADNCRVEGLTLRNANSHGLYIKSAGNSISRCLIASNDDRGVYFSSFGGNPSARIDHCTIADNGVSGLYVPDGNPGITVANCIIAFNDRALVSDGDGNGMTVEYNCAYEPVKQAELVAEGPGNVRQDPQFVDRSGGDYRLQRGSPCLSAAGNGLNIGCF